MTTYSSVDDLIDRRPGKELMTPVYDDPAHPVLPFVYRSGGTTAAYMIVTEAGRVIVNTGMFFEAPHHKRVFDAVCAGPTPYIVSTQAHVDHVGGVGLFREPDTQYVAQANNPACQRDDARIQAMRIATAEIWFGGIGDIARRIHRENPGVPMTMEAPTPDATFDDRLALSVGGLDLELISTPGGETVDACVVWIPGHRVAMVSNLFGPMFPHFPNLNTLRGDKYRFVEPYLAAIDTVRALRPEVLVTGRYEPIEGADLIDAALERLRAATDHVHRETLAAMNAGADLVTTMRAVRLPGSLRVGQGYGKVEWAVRTIWESYTGWFQRRSSTELYPAPASDALAELVDVCGIDAALARARDLVPHEPALAIHLAEAVLARDATNRDAARVMFDAHERLLSSGGDTNFWESGWLRDQIERWRAVAEG